MGVLSKGITLSYKTGAAGDFTQLTNLQEIPDLGGRPDTNKNTTLADDAHMYMDGIKNYGDSIAFKFLYDKTQFETLTGLTGTSTWKVTLPDTTTCTFSGTSSVKLDGVGVNAALGYTLAIKPSSAMVWA